MKRKRRLKPKTLLLSERSTRSQTRMQLALVYAMAWCGENPSLDKAQRMADRVLKMLREMA